MQKEEEQHHIIALLKVERLKGDPAKDSNKSYQNNCFY
jgi:hypothetical protein